MNLGISDKIAVVTGCSRGIGRGIAKALASEGATVVLVARSSDALEATRQQLEKPEKHHVVACDLMTTGGIKFLLERLEKLGDPDILIHNLGGSANVRQTFASSEDWKKVWELNLGTGLEINRVLIPKMVARRWGRIVHISTLSTSTFLGASAYVSAKCALLGYVKCVSREVSKDNVIVSAVSPGAISLEGRYFCQLENGDPAALDEYYNQHLPIRRFGQAEDVASVVAFLCSESASYLAGTNIAVDGGWK
jgi:3-oxoacyl-[acyl-carrier protein] reductase